MWNPETKSFRNISPCISKRDSQGQAVIDGEIFVVGGYDNISTKYDISKIVLQILDNFLQIFEIGGKIFTVLGFLDKTSFHESCQEKSRFRKTNNKPTLNEDLCWKVLSTTAIFCLPLVGWDARKTCPVLRCSIHIQEYGLVLMLI